MVTSFSPRRHHGEPTNLFSPPTTSPSQCTAFARNIQPAAPKTRSAARRSPRSPHEPRAHSPTKVPFLLTAGNSMNMRSESTSPHESPLRDATARTTLCPDPAIRPGGTSPLKRSDTMRGMDEASRGSPVAKRRNSQFCSLSSGQPPIFGSPSVGASTKRTGIKRSSVFDKPTHLRRSLPRSSLMDLSSSEPTSKMRRVTSVENFLGPPRDSPFTTKKAPLPNPSMHPHPLSRPAFGAPRQIHKLAAEENDWMTPQNYKSAKPNILAFHSTGFVQKRGRALDKDNGHQPDTPCKRPAGPLPGSAFHVSSKVGSKIPMADLGSPSTPVPLINQPGPSLLNRRNSTGSNVGSDYDCTQSTMDYTLPPTPTKKPANDFDDDSVFMTNKRLRPEDHASLAAESRVATASPRTPKCDVQPPDPSSLSISGKTQHYNPLSFEAASTPTNCVTPTRDFAHSALVARHSSPPFGDHFITEDGMSLFSKFSDVKHIGSGEFSEVYKVAEKSRGYSRQLFTPGRSSESGFSSSPSHVSVAPQIYAVKRAKQKFLGPRDRREKMQEVQILKELANHDHIVCYVDHWMDDGDYLCIQTEFCENGSLDKFLELHGTKGRLDEFRVWKILLELCLGLDYLHSQSFMHLDLKPGNVLITSTGSLKLGDFGMAMRHPPEYDLEKEGDRAYIAQEVLDRKPSQKSDIFSLGICIIEIASNQALPPYGLEWEALRRGDLSVAPVLSTLYSGELVHRDDDGNPVGTEMLPPPPLLPSIAGLGGHPGLPARQPPTQREGRLLHRPKPGHKIEPPLFMAKKGLERIVTKMIAERVEDRPTAAQLLAGEELGWVNARRKAAATIFEGLWGPAGLDAGDLNRGGGGGGGGGGDLNRGGGGGGRDSNRGGGGDLNRDGGGAGGGGAGGNSGSEKKKPITRRRFVEKKQVQVQVEDHDDLVL